MGLSPCLKFVIGRTLTILSWDNPVTAIFRVKKQTAPQPRQVIAQRFCSLSVCVSAADNSRCYEIDLTVNGAHEVYAELTVMKYRFSLGGY